MGITRKACPETIDVGRRQTHTYLDALGVRASGFEEVGDSTVETFPVCTSFFGDPLLDLADL